MPHKRIKSSFEGAHKAFSISIPLRIAIAGKRLVDPQGTTDFYEGQRRRLAAMVAHQGDTLTSDAIRELLVDRHIESS
jgi:hypothetical protein